MSNLECAIKILKERGDIECYAYGKDSMPMVYKLKSKSLKIANKFLNAFKEDDSYLVRSTTIPCKSMEFVDKKEFEQWLDDKCKDKETAIIPWTFSHLDVEMKKHAEEYGYEIERRKYTEEIEITNLKLKRKKKQELILKEQQALDLLDQIL